jgi:hypothetical protein
MRKTLIPILLIVLFTSAKGWTQTSAGEMSRYADAFGEEKPFAQGFIENASRRGADPGFVSEVLGRAKIMRDQGLPTEPFFLKASEGLVKNVPLKKINPVLDTTQKQTESAAGLVNQAIERGAIVPSTQAKREATLRFQKALLNQTPRSDLESLVKSVDPHSKVSIEQVGSAARALPKMNREGFSHKQALENLQGMLHEGSSKKSIEERPRPIEIEKPMKMARPEEEKEFKKESKREKVKKEENLEMKREKKEPHEKGSSHSWGPSPQSFPGKGHGRGK